MKSELSEMGRRLDMLNYMRTAMILMMDKEYHMNQLTIMEERMRVNAFSMKKGLQE
jgi:hypothetical protein